MPAKEGEVFHYALRRQQHGQALFQVDGQGFKTPFNGKAICTAAKDQCQKLLDYLKEEKTCYLEIEMAFGKTPEDPVLINKAKDGIAEPKKKKEGARHSPAPSFD